MALTTTYGRRVVPGLGTLVDLSHPLARGIVGAWLFNEGAGPRVRDSTGLRHYDGTTVVGDWVAGARSSAFFFDGSGTDFVEIPQPSDASLSGFSGISILGWIRPGTAQTGNLLNKDNNSAYRCRINSSRTVQFLVAGANQVTSTGTAPGDVWSHVAFTGDGTDLLKIYINGQFDTSGGFNNFPTGDAGGSLVFGTGAFGEIYAGALNEFYLYKRALTAAEVRWHYEEPFALYPLSPIRRWMIVPVAITEGTTAEWGLFEWGQAQWGSIETDSVPSGPNVSDSSSITENVIVRMLLSINVSDAVTLAENVELLRASPNDRLVIVNDVAAVTESVSVVVSLPVSASDTSTLSENVQVQMRLQISVSDSITLTDVPTLVIPGPPPLISVASSTVVTEGVTIHFGIDAVHTITITGSLEPFSQFHSIRVNPAAIQSYSDRDIQKPTGQVIRT